MPMYLFRCDCGKSQQRFGTMRRPLKRVTCECGKKAERDIVAEQRGNHSFKSSCWPRVSHSMAIRSKDVSRQQAILKRRGVHTDYTQTGEPIIRSPQHNKRHSEALGFTNLSGGGWSDPVAVLDEGNDE